MPFDASILRGLSGLQFRARYLVEGVLNGLHESPFRGFSSDFSEYRDYQQGDDLRHLDWRFYARADKLCIRRYEQETNLNFYVVCDSSASMAYAGTRAWASKLDAAKTLAAAFAWLLLKQKDSVGLLTFSHALWALAPAGVYLLIHILEGETITPLLLARRFTLNPLLVIVALMFWDWLWGVAGALLAVPLLAVFKILCDNIEVLTPVGHLLGAEPSKKKAG